MIPVANPIPEPVDFDVECRKKGSAWLAAERLAGRTPKTSQFPNYWARYESELAAAFCERCGWWAMWIAEGEVEHFLSKKNRPDLTYEWSNYRYISGSVNGSKGNHDDAVLDPFEVGDDWFEVILPSMQLVITDQLPAELLPKAEFTLERLHLCNGRKVIRCRKRWYEMRKKGELDDQGLARVAPLIAKAVRKLQDAGQPLP